MVGVAARSAVAAGVVGRVQRRQQQRWAEKDNAQYAPTYEQQAPPQQAPPAAAGGEADYTAELEKLAKLRDEGVISSDDFEAKKKQLLGI
ncbi:MAG TPA: SHOCT domain-containing protein [Solirubrobacterales bacterium]